MGVAKVILNGDTLIDVTQKTVTSSNLLSGETALNAAGQDIVGTYSGGGDDYTKKMIDRSITTIDWPNGITSIGDYAFAQCTNFAPQSLPNNITSIGAYAFYYCGNLDISSLPSGITSIGEYSFAYCSKISWTSLPSGITAIPGNIFRECRKLALTSLPNITSVGSYAFLNNAMLALTTLPSTLTTIQSSAFNGCSSITTISSDAPISTLSGGAFNGTSSCRSNLVSAFFPNMVVSVLYSTFGASATSNACTKLEVIDLGKTEKIGASAFTNCFKLQTMILRKTDGITILDNTNAFNNTPMAGYNSLTGTVYVPSALISTYQTATNWSSLYDQGLLAFAAIEGSQYELA